ncbi:MAG: insulinase family protein [Bacteroidetes bacterium]|nr:MAG: insulinase family protein [Bacteroidota bacterium]
MKRNTTNTIIEPVYPAFTKTTLKNGVRVVTETIPAMRSIAVGAWVFTGSRDERAEESGISHFIEHMVFKGTARRRMHQIAQRMEAVGGYLNAFTSKEYTCYYARALDEHLARAVDTVVDLVLHAEFPEKEIEKEKGVVLEEMKMYEDTPEEVIFDRFEALIYDGHALGRPIIGFPDTVPSFTRDQLFDYLERQYTPDRTVLAAAGNVRHEDVVALAEVAFRDADRAPGARTHTPVPPYTPAHHTEHRPIQQAHLVMGTRSYHIHDPRRMTLSVLNTILGGGMSSRLNQNIREKYGYCYSVYSFVNLHSDTGDFGVYMGTDPSKVDRARKLIQRELTRLAETPVSKRMLNQAKNQVKGSVMLGLESLSNRMMRIGRQELFLERYVTLDDVLAEVDAVTAEDVRQVAEDLFHPERLSSVVLLPQE